jgi:DNA-binding LytR/AlgR family response regulator
MNVLIVEDEPHAQNELKRLLDKSGRKINVLECVDSVEDAVEWLSSKKEPDLLFLDIQLADGLSFEIFKHIKIKVPVIFTTAFDEYAIQAFRVNSIDYLLKPVKLDDLNVALDKYRALKEQFGSRETTLSLKQVEELLHIHNPGYKTRFIAKVGDLIKHVDINDVAYFKAEDNEVIMITKANNRYIIDYSLDQLTGMLNPREFFRVNRSFIVTIGSIKKISKYFNSRLHLELNPDSDETILISRVKVPEFMSWMDQ